MSYKTIRHRFSLGLNLALASLLVALGAVPADCLTIPTVPVGNAGNGGELSGAGAGGVGPDAIVGAVSNNYRIGTTEVSNAQYAEFLNAKAASDPLALYNSEMGSGKGGITRSGAGTLADPYTYATISGRENMPVVYVSWYDAIRFANWLHNGQGSGDTETGAYTLEGGTPIPDNGDTIARNPGAIWFLTSEDEWYKAAYHGNNGVTDDYADYPTKGLIDPRAGSPPGDPKFDWANYDNAVGDLTLGGAYTSSESRYDTFDQAGNVWEWNEALISESSRGMRGGSWSSRSGSPHAAIRESNSPSVELDDLGFRVATVPEPGTAVLGIIGIGFTVLCWRRRK